MKEFLAKLMSSDFMPHGYCYLWRSDIVWLHAISDGVIMFSYYVIPILLLYFVRKRRDLPFHWVFLMFGVFIFGCGTTHLMEVWTLWHGTYRLSGVIKAITAGASLATATALVPMIPKALALPSPAALKLEIADRQRAEQALRRVTDELEVRVKERTMDLQRANESLVVEIEQRKRVEVELRAAEMALQKHKLELQSLAGRLITVQEDERRRVARELHDDLSQRLALQGIALDLVCQGLPSGSEAVRELRRLRQETGRLALNVRQISHDLHHPQLALGFQRGATSLCRDFSKQHGIAIELRNEGDLSQIPEMISTVLFRVLQEALANVANHSGADRACVLVAVEGSQATLRVIDGGRGFETETGRSHGGLGLISMRERLRLVGGTMEVTSSPTDGTEIRVEIPINLPAVTSASG